MRLAPKPPASLAHIPSLPGLPVLGHTLEHINDAYGHCRRSAALGPAYLSYILGRWRVTIPDPDAIQYMLTDPDDIFSARDGHDILHPIFAGGLPVRDFDEHRRHRRIMQEAFRADAMKGYIAMMIEDTAGLSERLPAASSFRLGPAIRRELLRMGGKAMMGLDAGSDELAALNRAFADERDGCISLVRRPLPFTRMRRGMRGRRVFEDRMRAMIPERRTAGGEDFFSRMCQALDAADGWTEQEVLDHFNFLVFASHDTTASGLVTMAWGLGRNPDWQDEVAREAAALDADLRDLHARGDRGGAFERLRHAPKIHQTMMEALRLYPPAPFVTRTPVRDISLQGIDIPAGTPMTVAQGIVMRDPDLYTDPDRFDPTRFAPGREEHRRHPFAWIPFSGGPHKCIGMHFAQYQVRIVVAALLARYRIVLDAPDTPYRIMPVPAPRDDLPVRLIPRD